VAGCTLAQQWARAAGCLPPGLNARVLADIAARDTTGKHTLFTRGLGDAPPSEAVLKCTPEEFAETEARGRVALDALHRELAPLLAATLVAAPLTRPEGTILYVVDFPDARKLGDLAEWLWDVTGATDPKGPVLLTNAVLLMRTGKTAVSLRNAPHATTSALQAARFLVAKYNVKTPAGGHGPAAGATLPEGDLDDIFKRAAELALGCDTPQELKDLKEARGKSGDGDDDGKTATRADKRSRTD
jgi:hypothetical protein